MGDLSISFSDVTSLIPQKATPVAIGGGLEGADRLNRETLSWGASTLSPDRIINTVKETADARGRDSVRNDGYISGAATVHKDSIVGAQFRLNAKPAWTALAGIFNNKAFDDTWAEEMQVQMEARFGLLADSNECWLDASRRNTLTGMVRLAIGIFLATGETLGVAEWVRESERPYKTAIQMVRTDRLCNPWGQVDTRYLRRGIALDERGKPLSYWIRKGEKYEVYPDDYAWTWTNVPIKKPWGRKQVIHIIEQADSGQSRGIADIVAALKNIRMTKRFREIVLQNAVINATYAAAIESELPTEMIQAALGQGSGTPQDNIANCYGGFLSALESYLTGSKNIAVDGAMIPHLFPGTKMKLQNAGTPGGVGTSFEDSLLRHTAATLGVSYESLSRDFSKTNYSSGKLAMNVQGQAMASRKKHVADRFATEIYALQFEEMMAAGDIVLPVGVKRDTFYAPLAKEAYTKCSWLGSGSGQVDELKETQAAILRIRSGLTTHEIEGAKLGLSWREVAVQRGREIRAFTAAGFTPVYDALKPQDKLGTDVPADDPTDNVTGDPADVPTKGGNA